MPGMSMPGMSMPGMPAFLPLFASVKACAIVFFMSSSPSLYMFFIRSMMPPIGSSSPFAFPCDVTNASEKALVLRQMRGSQGKRTVTGLSRTEPPPPPPSLGFSLSSYQFLSEYESVFAFCGYQYRKAGRAAVSSSQPGFDDLEPWVEAVLTDTATHGRRFCFRWWVP